VFNLQGQELIIILLLALVVLGPEKLPEAMRKLGQFVAQMKKMSAGFQQEFKAAVDEPMREVRKTADMLRDSVDFRKLQDGERDEKPKSAEMAAVTPEPAVDIAPETAVETSVETPVETPAAPASSEPIVETDTAVESGPE
jgi:sec-independent protein translocase protein TatB